MKVKNKVLNKLLARKIKKIKNELLINKKLLDSKLEASKAVRMKMASELATKMTNKVFKKNRTPEDYEKMVYGDTVDNIIEKKIKRKK